MRQIILDTETTGLEPKEGHRIIEIGCLEMVNRRLTGNNLHLYINPERPVERGAEEVHGITDAFLADKPVFKDIVAEFIKFVDGAELIIHNAPFDVGFLNHELMLLGRPYKKITAYCGVVDTLVLARQKHPGQQNSLDALCRRYHVDNSNRDLHGALLDSELLAQVYLLLTGGQSQLFASSADSSREELNVAEIQRLTQDRAAIKVIAANADELQQHNDFMAQFSEEK